MMAAMTAATGGSGGKEEGNPGSVASDAMDARPFAAPLLQAIRDREIGPANETEKAPPFGDLQRSLLSVKEVAEQLRVATATVYGLCADGRLAHVLS
jgi:hypothetical protein